MIPRELSGEEPRGGEKRDARHPSARLPDEHWEELEFEEKMRQAFTVGGPRVGTGGGEAVLGRSDLQTL